MTITDINAPDLIDRAIAVIDDEIARLTSSRTQLVGARDALRGALTAAYPPPATSTTGSASVTSITSRSTTRAKTKPKTTRAKTKPAQAPAPRSSSTPASVDYAKVAEVIRAARAAGKPVRRAVMDAFGARETTVNNWITKVYQLGLVDRPTPTTAPTPAASGPAPSTRPPSVGPAPSTRPPSVEVAAAVAAVADAEEGLAAL